MMRIRGLRRLAPALALALSIGCGGAGPTTLTPETVSQDALRDIGEMYRLYVASHKGKAPAKAEDCKSAQTAAPAGYRAAKEGSVVVMWGAAMPDTSEEGSKDPDDVVLAYKKDVPENGGPVLMLNRTVKTMTADEFKAAKKAGK